MLLSGQSKLARLPVPQVDVTLRIFEKSLIPLLSDAELRRVQSLARDFAASEASRTLQQMLVARDASEPNSWLETWWNRIAYLQYREPSVINVNFAMPFRFPPTREISCTQSVRAALLTRAAIEYKQLVDLRQLPPDPQPNDQLPHTRIFNACRVPAPQCDQQARYDGLSNHHIVVVRNDVFWKLHIPASDPVPSVSALESAFRRILEDGRVGHPMGVFTALHRDDWATIRGELLLRNDENFHVIQSASFVVCLDHTDITSPDQLFDAVLMADRAHCSNRWYDKPIQIIVFNNAWAGLNGEHSPVDGEPVARLADWILERELAIIKELAAANNNKAIAGGQNQLTVTPLSWNLSSAHVLEIRKGLAFAGQQIDNLFTKQLHFDHFGKETIVSPDAVCQAAMQLAYHRTHGAFTPAYESASTRRFLAGRTETGRTLTPELAAFCLAMDDDAVSKEDKRTRFVDATTAHVAYMRQAVQGVGCDRHLLGLRLLSKSSGIKHAFLEDPSLALSTHWRLSTSQLPVHRIVVGFGPVVPDGYGICYQIHATHLHFAISCFRSNGSTNSQRMADAIEKALLDISALFHQSAKL